MKKALLQIILILTILTGAAFAGNMVTTDGQAPGITIDTTDEFYKINITDGIEPPNLGIGDIWRQIFPAEVFGPPPFINPATDTLQIKNSVGTFDLLGPHLSGIHVFVDSLTDLPAPVAGKITLEPKRYTFRSNFVTPYSFIIPDLPLGGGVIFEGGSILYTGSGTLFECTDLGKGFAVFRNVSFAVLPGSSAILFNISGSGIANSLILGQSVLIFNFESLGSISDIDLTSLISVNFQGIGTGLVCTNIGAFGLDFSPLSNWRNDIGAKMISFFGTIGEIGILGNTFKPQSEESVFYFDPSATYNSVIISANTFAPIGGKFYATGSLDQTDPRFKVKGNQGIADSTTTAQGIATPVSPIITDIPAESAQVLLNLSTNWSWDQEERITGDTSGVTTYAGREDTTLLVDGNIELAPQTATNQFLRAQFVEILADDLRAVTFDDTTEDILETTTPRLNDDRISFYNTQGTLPVGLRKDVIYWVVNQAADSFQVSYTKGGAAVAFTNNEVGNTYAVAEMFGGIGRGQIADPTQLIPQSLVEISTDQQIGITVWNDSGNTDIESEYAYYRIKE